MKDPMQEWLSAPAAYPEARRAIEALDPIVREDLDRGLERVELHAGETLFACGDPRDAAFLIVSGRFSLEGEGLQGGFLPGHIFSPGEGLGEIGLASRGPHTTTARALEDATVLRLDRIAFEGLCEKYPDAMRRLADFIAPVADETLLARVLCDLLGERDAAQLAVLLAKMECRELKRGDVLYRQGEDADLMFVVIFGRLRMVAQDGEGTEAIIDEVGRGDTVGWKTMLTGDPRATTVYALRESAVGVITRPLFENLSRQYPEVMTRLARVALRRARHPDALPGSSHASSAVSFAVLPVGVSRGRVPLTTFAQRLASTLGAYGTSLHLGSTLLDGIMGRHGIAQADAGNSSEPVLAAWLREQEHRYSYVVYEADDAWTPWTERCLRMADRVLLIGQGASVPTPTELDEPLARLGNATTTELVLLQPEHISRPSGTAAWLNRYATAAHHHVRLDRAADFDSFVRQVTGRGLGLVLGGGGARGFAHIGVFRALAEYEIAVDLVGGTSIGAILGGMFAMGLDDRDISTLAREMASPLKLFDPTVPVVSFFASRKVTRVLERIFGDVQIEDLWTPCFCVSSNLTHAVAMVHRRGPLWQAARASMAIPGVFSPILAEGDLLVDGCVLNNLPIDVMQRLNQNGPIIAVNVFPDVDLLRDYDFGPSISGWRALASRLNPLKRKDNNAPVIFESLLRVLALNDVHQAKTKRGFADVYIRPPVEKYNILDFGAYVQIADIGYQSAMGALRDWEDLRKRGGERVETDSACTTTRPGSGDTITAHLKRTLTELEELLAHMESPLNC